MRPVGDWCELPRELVDYLKGHRGGEVRCLRQAQQALQRSCLALELSGWPRGLQQWQKERLAACGRPGELLEGLAKHFSQLATHELPARQGAVKSTFYCVRQISSKTAYEVCSLGTGPMNSRAPGVWL